MQIEVFRDACCAADDQAGPLAMKFELDGHWSFPKLVELVLESGFLQYSSTNTTMLGYIDGVAVVRVHSPYYSKEKTQYLIDPATTIQEALREGSIDFRF